MKKKVGLICNMNNNLFNLGRYLSDKGYDATLYVLPFESKHFYPEAEAGGDKLTVNVKYLTWGDPYELGKISAEEIRKEFGQHAFLIGCGSAPAYLHKAGIRLDLFTPYGTDLVHYPFFNVFRPKKLISYISSLFRKASEIKALPSKPANMKGYVPFVYRQRKGIQASVVCAVPTSGEDIYGEALKKLRFSNKHYTFAVPMVYTPQYNQDAIRKLYPSSTFHARFAGIRKENDFVIFHNCRHSWCNGDVMMYKGNNRLFEGFARFVKTYKGKAAIVTFEYGTDVDASKKLARDLDIESNVHWFPIAYRRELMVGMSMCDLVAGNLSDASWPIYGVVYESMTLAKPIMHHRDDQLYPRETLYPMINAYNETMVAEALTRYGNNLNELSEMGQQVNRWFMQSCIEGPIDTIINMIESKPPAR